MALTTSQYNSILRDYDYTRYMHQHEQSARQNKIYAECPRLAELHAEITSASAAMARLKISGSEGELAAVSAKRDKLRRERDAIVAAHDYDLELHYTCPDCKDTGFIGQKKCRCFIQKSIQLRYSESGILPDLLRQQNFSTFNLGIYSDAPNPALKGISNREHMSTILSRCLEYTDAFPDGGKSLLIFGATGVGKTFLVNCIADRLLQRDFTVVYTSADNLFDVAVRRQTDSADCVDIDELFYECDLLVIDDLGAEKLSEFKKAYLLKIINTRYSSKAPVIISTNLDPNELQYYYDERISSRLIGLYESIPIFGNDARIRPY